MNKFKVRTLFTPIKFLSVLSFQGQKERRKANLNAKDIDTRLSQIIFSRRAFRDTVLKKIKMN